MKFFVRMTPVLLFSFMALGAEPICKPTGVALFQSTEPLEIEIKSTFPLPGNDRGSKNPLIEGEIRYEDAEGKHSLPVSLQARGKSRLFGCAFRPINIVWKKDVSRRGTIFDVPGKDMKLVNHCFYDSGTIDEHEDLNQFVYREYSLYKLIEAAQLPVYGVRLVKIQYRDSSGRKTVEGMGYFIEPPKSLERRCEAEHLPHLQESEHYFQNMDQTIQIPFLLSRLLVDAKDYRVQFDQNAELYLDPNKERIKIVFPYDFNDAGFLRDQPNYIDWSFGPLLPWFQLLAQGPFNREGELEPLLSSEQAVSWHRVLSAESKLMIERRSALQNVIPQLPLREDAKIELQAQVDRFYVELERLLSRLGLN